MPAGLLALVSGDAVLHFSRSGHAGTVGAAEDGTVRLHAVADDPDAAVLAGRGERVDRALEAVEHVRLVVGQGYPKRLVVFVAAHLTFGHLFSSSTLVADIREPKNKVYLRHPPI